MSGRTGGDVVVEALRSLGADTVFGLPGQHALGVFDALRKAPDLKLIQPRLENNVTFAADGYARAHAGDRVPVTPLIVSTGPGALLTLPALHEARAASVPLLAIASQVPVAGLGGARRGYLHELEDQADSVRRIVKSVHPVRSVSQIPAALRAAWESAASVPFGPVWVEIPQDVLLATATVPPITELTAQPRALPPAPDLVAEAARMLDTADNPVILAGGGVVRARAGERLRTLAEALRAPVLTTFGGKGAFPWDHPLSARSWLEDGDSTELLASADVLLVLGSGLGELSSNYHQLVPRGEVIQVEADAGKLESNHRGLGIHADVSPVLDAVLGTVRRRKPDGRAERVVAELLTRIKNRVAAQSLETEQCALADIRDALPSGIPTFWDMTILGYWAWSAWNADDAPMHSAQGAGGLGYALPAALGAAVGTGGRTLAVSGDGGAMYGLAELATAVAHQLDVTWLIVDDGGYGILREYLTTAFGRAEGTDLVRPDFVALAHSFGVTARETNPRDLRGDLARALRTPGPNVLVLPVRLRMFAATPPPDTGGRVRDRP